MELRFERNEVGRKGKKGGGRRKEKNIRKGDREGGEEFDTSLKYIEVEEIKERRGEDYKKKGEYFEVEGGY